MLDTLRQVETPEGLSLELRSAGVFPRAYAWLLDLGIRVAGVSMLSMLLAFLGEAGTGVLLVAMFLLYWGYPIAFEVLRDGQTIGKRVMGLRVVNANGTPVTWLPSVVRNLLRTVDMLPFGYALGLLSSLFDRNGRRLGDLVAGTVVVHDSGRPWSASVAIDTVLAPPQPLQPAEQAAIIAFAERAPRLSGPRQQELAAVAAPISGGQGQVGVLRLYAMANWLLGRR